MPAVSLFLAYRVHFNNIWQCANFDSIQFQRFSPVNPEMVAKTVSWTFFFTTSGSRKTEEAAGLDSSTAVVTETKNKFKFYKIHQNF